MRTNKGMASGYFLPHKGAKFEYAEIHIFTSRK
jgi:hypothetical protein